jgi:hypothetical protein
LRERHTSHTLHRYPVRMHTTAAQGIAQLLYPSRRDSVRRSAEPSATCRYAHAAARREVPFAERDRHSRTIQSHTRNACGAPSKMIRSLAEPRPFSKSEPRRMPRAASSDSCGRSWSRTCGRCRASLHLACCSSSPPSSPSMSPYSRTPPLSESLCEMRGAAIMGRPAVSPWHCGCCRVRAIVGAKVQRARRVIRYLPCLRAQSHQTVACRPRGRIGREHLETGESAPAVRTPACKAPSPAQASAA